MNQNPSIHSTAIGIVGGGQLGKMMAEAAKGLDLKTIVLDPTPQSPAGQVTEQVLGDFRDHNTIMSFAQHVDVLTFEIESANAEALTEIAATGKPVHPKPETLAVIKDKFAQKTFLEKRGIAVGPFMQVDSEEDAQRAGDEFGYPFVLKARGGGYDGRGNATVESAADVARAVASLGQNLYAEKFVPFEKELAVIAARTVDGAMAIYPLVETTHKNHICDTVLAPAPVSEKVAEAAHAVAEKVLQAFSGAGVFAIEMFLTKEGEVLVNEVAPRVHNSGHFSIEACETSQFEQHMRAVAGLPLGETRMKVPAAVMVNILGERNGPAEARGVEEAHAVPGVTVHLYGKLETRRGRKMGHLTAVAETLEDAQKNALKARALISI